MARRVGYQVAQRGGVLISGGLGGVMEASCEGAKAGGGITIGILPGTEKRDANPFVDFPIPTGFGEARNLVIIRTADILVAIGKSFGTLSEIAFALKMGKEIIGIETFDLEGVYQAKSPEEAVALIFSHKR